MRLANWVLKLKEDTTGVALDELSLLNVFKIGTSAGGARPKILISEHKKTGEIKAGDRETSEDYNHYLVKLHLDDGDGYDKDSDKWNLGPAYDLTYALNPLLTFKTTSRALSINAKRTEITLTDVLIIADEFAIKNPKGIVEEIQRLTSRWRSIAKKLEIPADIIEKIKEDLSVLK